jgi:hypothetical protein
VSLWRHLCKALFVGDPNWTWRRRSAISGGVMALAGFAHGVWFDAEIAHAAMVVTNSIALFMGCLGTYTAAVVTDEHLRRRSEARPGPGHGD